MLISYKWLRELTGTRLTPNELRERLTMTGLAIDTIEEGDSDFVLDVEVPSNRPDCLSHIGIAREVAVIESTILQYPAVNVSKVEGKIRNLTSVEIRAPDLCPRYSGRIVRGVKIGPSTAWLTKRLIEIGQRAVNNVADITNYVLHELGQPLHAFDLAKLIERRIVVRRAREGETLITLDGVKRSLDSEVLVIADAERAVALAGIMGGENSEISDETTDVLVESAYFNPDSVRRTARRLGMDTEASRRFERGADCANVLQAQARCVELICEIAGGVATEDAIDVYPGPLPPRRVDFRSSRVESLTSLHVESAEMNRILLGLGFTKMGENDQVMTFLTPSWRVDIEREEDLVEEVARHSGYDKIAAELPPSSMSGEYQPGERKLRALRQTLKAAGFHEAINFSFVSAAHDESFETLPALIRHDEPEQFVTLKNPILGESNRMRPTLLLGLLESARHNFNQGIRDLYLFETGRVFAASSRGEIPRERESLGLLATGGSVEEGRAGAARALDFYDLKGSLEAIADEFNVGALSFGQTSARHLRPGQSARITLSDGVSIGTIGKLSDALSSAYKFRQDVYVAEVDLTTLLAAEQPAGQYQPLPRYPSVVRDVTLLLSRDINVAQLLKAVEAEGIDDYREAKLVGTYEGPTIPHNQRSVTIRVEYRSSERTLRDEEVEGRQRKLIDSLVTKFGAELH